MAFAVLFFSFCHFVLFLSLFVLFCQFFKTCLSGVSQYSRSIADEEEVDGDGGNDKSADIGGRNDGRVIF